MLGLLALALLAASPSTDPSLEAEKAAGEQEKMICKRFLETGSLVKAQRICKTKRQWEISRAEIRDRGNPGANSCSAAGEGGPC